MFSFVRSLWGASVLGQGSPAGLAGLLEERWKHSPASEQRIADSEVPNSGKLHLGALTVE